MSAPVVTTTVVLLHEGHGRGSVKMVLNLSTGYIAVKQYSPEGGWQIMGRAKDLRKALKAFDLAAEELKK